MVTGDDFLKLAQHCLSAGCESGYRSCISRVYYGMFHETLSYLSSVPNYSSNHHASLIGYMTTPAQHKGEPYDSKRLRVLGYNLKQQRDARNEADYHLKEVTVSEDMANTSLEASNLYIIKWGELIASKAS